MKKYRKYYEFLLLWVVAAVWASLAHAQTAGIASRYRNDVGIKNDPAVISVSGNVLGGADALEFTKTVGDLVRNGESYVVIDLSNVELMNSSGLGMLVGASTSLRSANGSLVVAGASQKLQNLFKMTRLDSVLAQFSSREEAVAARQQG